jgi:anaerobic selenocysteine-containing dehydrogenase
MTILKTYCRFCLAHCALTAHSDDLSGEIIFRGDPNDPISKGYSCSKGRALGVFNIANRLLEPSAPSLGIAGRWTEVIGSFSKRIEAAIKKGGNNAFGIYTGTNSILDAAGQWAAIGLMIRLQSCSIYSPASIDHACRPFVAEHMCGVPSLFPQLHDDAKLWVLVGTNPVVSHGHIAGCPNPVDRIRTFKKRGGKLIVIDPRKTQTARSADIHINNKPGSDYYLLGYLIKEILREGSDQQFLNASASGLENLRLEVSPYCREDIEKRVGIPVGQADCLLKAIRQNRRCAVICGTGVTFSQEAIRTEFFSWALMAITGSLDCKEGCWFNPGWFGLRAGPQYARTNGSGEGPKSRPELQNRMGEMPCAALADEIEAGNLKTLMILGGNPLASIANGKRLGAAFKKLDALGIADIKNNDLIRCATHVFPLASQLERSDATVYVDKNMSAVYARYTKPIVVRPAHVRPQWWVIQKIGEALGVDAVGIGIKADELSDDDVLRSISRRDMVSFDLLESTGFQSAEREQPVGWIRQWVKEGKFKWNLYPPCKKEPQYDEQSSDQLVLVSGRQRRHINSTFVDEQLAGVKSDALLMTINPRDAENKLLKDGDRVEISNKSGRARLKIRVSEEVRTGVVHIPHGWDSILTSEYARVDSQTGMICQTAIPIDKIEKIPEMTKTRCIYEDDKTGFYSWKRKVRHISVSSSIDEVR